LHEASFDKFVFLSQACRNGLASQPSEIIKIVFISLDGIVESDCIFFIFENQLTTQNLIGILSS